MPGRCWRRSLISGGSSSLCLPGMPSLPHTSALPPAALPALPFTHSCSCSSQNLGEDFAVGGQLCHDMQYFWQDKVLYRCLHIHCSLPPLLLQGHWLYYMVKLYAPCKSKSDLRGASSSSLLGSICRAASLMPEVLWASQGQLGFRCIWDYSLDILNLCSPWELVLGLQMKSRWEVTGQREEEVSTGG